MAQPLGVILAGGQGTRMGGLNKALIQLCGRPLMHHVADRLAPMAAEVVISCNDPALVTDLTVIPDDLPDFQGPLAGILAALDWAFARGHTHVVSVATDTPFFPLDLVDHLQGAANPMGLCLAASLGPEGEELLQPTFGLWPTALRQDLRAFLISGERRVRRFAQEQGAWIALFPGASDPFFNINTPEDLALAEVLCGGNIAP